MTHQSSRDAAASHYCVVCAARWKQWPDQSWSLVSDKCGPCCDNVAMGDQIISINATGAEYDAARRKIAEQQWRDDKARHAGQVCALCGEEFHKHNVDWTCRTRMFPRFKAKIDRATVTAELVERLTGEDGRTAICDLIAANIDDPKYTNPMYRTAQTIADHIRAVAEEG